MTLFLLVLTTAGESKSSWYSEFSFISELNGTRLNFRYYFKTLVVSGFIYHLNCFILWRLCVLWTDRMYWLLRQLTLFGRRFKLLRLVNALSNWIIGERKDFLFILIVFVITLQIFWLFLLITWLLHILNFTYCRACRVLFHNHFTLI